MIIFKALNALLAMNEGISTDQFDEDEYTTTLIDVLSRQLSVSASDFTKADCTATGEDGGVTKVTTTLMLTSEGMRFDMLESGLREARELLTTDSAHSSITPRYERAFCFVTC